MLELNRESLKIANQCKDTTNNLQTKYQNLDRFYVSKEKFDEEFNKHEVMLLDLNEKVQELLGEYDSEDESERNASIENVSGDLAGSTLGDMKAEDKASRASYKPLAPNVGELMIGGSTGNNLDAKSLGSAKGPKKSSFAATKNNASSSSKEVIPTGLLDIVKVPIGLDLAGITMGRADVQKPPTKRSLEPILEDDNGTGQASSKGAAINEDQMKSIMKSARDQFDDGKSSRTNKSFAKSIRSRRLAP